MDGRIRDQSQSILVSPKALTGEESGGGLLNQASNLSGSLAARPCIHNGRLGGQITDSGELLCPLSRLLISGLGGLCVPAVSLYGGALTLGKGATKFGLLLGDEALDRGLTPRHSDDCSVTNTVYLPARPGGLIAVLLLAGSPAHGLSAASQLALEDSVKSTRGVVHLPVVAARPGAILA